MTALHCLVVETRRQLGDVFSSRWRVLSSNALDQRPEDAKSARSPGAPRRGMLETTLHFAAYCGSAAVADLRLVLPDAAAAGVMQGRDGIDLESSFDLGDFHRSGLSPGEIKRSDVRRLTCDPEALRVLWSKLHLESRRRGVTHWITAASTSTDSQDDASLMLRVAERMGLVSREWRVGPKTTAPPPRIPQRPVYSDEQRASARAGDLSDLTLPRTLHRILKRLEGSLAGEPTYDPAHRIFTVPVVAAVPDALPPSMRPS